MTKRSLAFVLLLCGAAPAQWVKQVSGTGASLRGVKAISDKICWASGTGGTVLKTIDGGNHWQMIHVAGAEKLDFRDIEVPNNDAKTAIVMSSGPAEQGQAKIFKTTDGGEHWKLVFSTDRKGVFFDSIAFWNNQHGIGLSDPVDGKFVLFATDDGGATWHFVIPQQMPDALPGEGGFAASGTTIVAAGKHDAWFGTGGAKVSRIFHSKDTGKTWTAVETPIPAGKPSAGIFSVAYSQDLKRVTVAGGDYANPTKMGENLTATEDGDLHWMTGGELLPYISGIAISWHAIIFVGSAGLNPRTGYLDPHSFNLNATSTAPHSGKTWAVGPKGVVVTLTIHAVD